MHTKLAICLSLCLLFAGLAGCGSSGEETASPREAAKELARWFRGVEEAVAEREQEQRGFPRFHVSAPPANSGIVELSPAGAAAGETAKGAANQLDVATTLTQEEAAGLYCYFFAFYVDLPSSPDRKEFEVVINNLVKKHLSPTASPADISKSADGLRRAMIEAEKAGRRGGEVAAAGFC